MWRKNKPEDLTPEPPGQHNLISNSQCRTHSSYHSEYQAPPPPIQYETHSSYCSKFKVTCYTGKDAHQQGITIKCRPKQSFRVSKADIQWALYYLHTKTSREVDKLSITDDFNSLIKSTTNFIQMASKRIQLPQYRSHAAELQTVWKLV